MKEIINTSEAPKAIGPYSQGNKFGNMVFISGQLPIDPTTGQMAPDIETQAKQSLENVKAILKAAGTDFSKVLKVTIFMIDLANFKTVNEIYSTYFTGDYPARSTIQVAKLPMDAQIEIEVIAAV